MVVVTSGYILKAESAGFSENLDVGQRREGKGPRGRPSTWKSEGAINRVAEALGREDGGRSEPGWGDVWWPAQWQGRRDLPGRAGAVGAGETWLETVSTPRYLPGGLEGSTKGLGRGRRGSGTELWGPSTVRLRVKGTNRQNPPTVSDPGSRENRAWVLEPGRRDGATGSTHPCHTAPGSQVRWERRTVPGFGKVGATSDRTSARGSGEARVRASRGGESSQHTRAASRGSGVEGWFVSFFYMGNSIFVYLWERFSSLFRK